MTDPAFSPELDAVLAVAAPLGRRFAEAGHRLYLVGGVVRDHLSGRIRAEQDLDATTEARPDRIKEVVGGVAEAVWTQGERFGTIGCVVEGRTWEITTHRAESYAGDSRKPTVTFGDRIEDDLARRDFTVNAMAIDVATRELVDPHDGRGDLRARVLRTPLDPEVSFSDDPLRMLRAARFHADLGLTPDPALTGAISAMTDRMEIVSAERVRDELQKLILLDDPQAGLALLAETGLLPVVLPMWSGDLARSARRVAEVAPDPAPRWAALLLDGDLRPAALRGLVFSGRLTAEIVWLASSDLLDADDDARLDAAAVRRAAAIAPSGRTLEDQLDFVAAIARADDRPAASVDAARELLVRLRVHDDDLDDPPSVLTGDQVGAALGLEPGPDIGVALAWLRDLRFAEGPVDPDDATTRLRSWWAGRTGR